MSSNARLPPRLAMACAVALAIGVAAAGLDRPRGGLVDDPSRCAGIVDGLAAWVARVLPSAGVGAIVGAINSVALAAATFALVRLATVLQGSLIAASATALAFVVTPLIARAAAPGDALAIAAACLATGAILTARGGACDSTGRLLSFVIGLAVIAAVTPTDTVPLAIAGAAVVVLLHRHVPPARRAALSAGTALAVLAAGWTTMWLVPSMPAFEPAPCGLLHHDGPSIGAIVAAIRTGSTGVGAAMLAFAILGLAARSSERTAAVVIPWALLVVVPLIGAGLNVPSSGTPALLLVAIGVCCVAGMDLLVDRASGGAARWAALAFAIAVPVLQHAGVPRGAEAPAMASLGHRSMTHRDASAVMSALPPGAWLVIEDALTDVLLRSVASTKGVRGVAPRGDAVRAALRTGPVYLLPRARLALQLEGLRAEATGRTGAPGLARIVEDLGCSRPGSTWRAWQPPPAATGFALVADDDGERGPVVMYLIAHALPVVRPHDASVLAGRGVFIWDYDLESARDRERLANDGRHDALEDAPWPAGAARFVKRVEVWRAPGVGRVVAIDVEGPVVAAAVRVASGAIGPPPRLCPTVVAPIEPLASAR